MVEKDFVESALADARDRYEALESEVGGRRLLARLQAENRHHPLLVTHRALVVGTWLLGLLTAASVVAPLFSPEAAVTLGRIELVVQLPVPFLLLAMTCCTGVIGTSLRFVAEWRGQKSPLLPREEAARTELVQEIGRLHRAKADLEAPPVVLTAEDFLAAADPDLLDADTATPAPVSGSY